MLRIARSVALSVSVLTTGLVSGGIASSTTAVAQTAAEAQLNAVSFLPVKPGTPLRVRLLDDSNANLNIKKRFENALAANGFVIQSDAELVLTFETQEDMGSFEANGRRHILELKAEGGREGGEDASAIVNVFNSKSGGLLNKGNRPNTQITSQSMYRMDATIDNTSNGRRMWEGWAVGALTHTGPDDLANAMVPALAAHVGKSAKQVVVPLN